MRGEGVSSDRLRLAPHRTVGAGDLSLSPAWTLGLSGRSERVSAVRRGVARSHVGVSDDAQTQRPIWSVTETLGRLLRLRVTRDTRYGRVIPFNGKEARTFPDTFPVNDNVIRCFRERHFLGG